MPSRRPIQASSARDLQGAWKIIEVATRSPGGNWAISTPPYLSVYIFTSRHYSYMFAPGVGPRRLFVGDPNQPTDAEKVTASRLDRGWIRDLRCDRVDPYVECDPTIKPQRNGRRGFEVHRGHRWSCAATDDRESAIRSGSRTPHDADQTRMTPANRFFRVAIAATLAGTVVALSAAQPPP